MCLPKPHCWLIGVCLAIGLLGCDQSEQQPEQQSEQNPAPATISKTKPEAKPETRIEQAPTAHLPAISVKDVMVGAIEPTSNGIWAIALEENAPQTAAQWQAVEHEVVQLLAATAATALGGDNAQDRAWVQQPAWQGYTEQMASIGTDILQAVRARDYDAAVDASNRLVEPCGACHAAFPGESQVPTDAKQIPADGANPNNDEMTP